MYNKDMNKENVLINHLVPRIWANRLRQLAREASVREERSVTVSELVREAIREKYGLPDNQITDDQKEKKP